MQYTVKELREKLKEFPQDSKISLHDISLDESFEDLTVEEGAGDEDKVIILFNPHTQENDADEE